MAPTAHCRALVVVKIERRKQPLRTPSSKNLPAQTMTRNEAADLVNRLLGSYPQLNLHDPEVYMTGLVSLLCKYPLEAGETVIGQVTATTKWPPAHGEVAMLLNEATAFERRMQEREARAQ